LLNQGRVFYIVAGPCQPLIFDRFSEEILKAFQAVTPEELSPSPACPSEVVRILQGAGKLSTGHAKKT
jgi:hypothetical protein